MKLDIVLVLATAIMAYVGYRKGLVSMLMNFFGTFAAALISYFFFGSFKELLVKFTGIDEFIFQKVVERMQALGAHAAKTSVSSMDIDAVGKMSMPDVIKTKLTDYLTESSSAVSKSAALSITDLIMSIVTVVIMFFSLIILFRIISKALNLTAKLPVISAFNSLGGLLFSLLSFYLILTIVFLLATSIAPLETQQSLAGMIKDSVIAKYLIENNPFLIMLANITF